VTLWFSGGSGFDVERLRRDKWLCALVSWWFDRDIEHGNEHEE
jgi:hypothetical protein